MRKILLSLAVTTTIFAVNSAFAMEVEGEQAPQTPTISKRAFATLVSKDIGKTVKVGGLDWTVLPLAHSLNINPEDINTITSSIGTDPLYARDADDVAFLRGEMNNGETIHFELAHIKK